MNASSTEKHPCSKDNPGPRPDLLHPFLLTAKMMLMLHARKLISKNQAHSPKVYSRVITCLDPTADHLYEVQTSRQPQITESSESRATSREGAAILSGVDDPFVIRSDWSQPKPGSFTCPLRLGLDPAYQNRLNRFSAQSCSSLGGALWGQVQRCSTCIT